MSVTEVVGLEGVGGEVSGLIRVWKSVEKSKFLQRKEEYGKNSVPPRGRLEAGVDGFGFQG